MVEQTIVERMKKGRELVCGSEGMGDWAQLRANQTDRDRINETI